MDRDDLHFLQKLGNATDQGVSHPYVIHQNPMGSCLPNVDIGTMFLGVHHLITAWAKFYYAHSLLYTEIRRDNVRIYGRFVELFLL
jgi:hypothetical protein